VNKNQAHARHARSFNLKPLTAIILGALALQAQAADTFTMLGNLDATNNYSYPYAVSGDGSTVVGESTDSNGNNQAMRWTAGGGMQGLGFLDTRTTGGYYYSYANAVSADGSTVVGQSSNSNGNNEAFRWTSTGMQGLGFIGAGPRSYISSHAQAVSADGSVVVGYSTYSPSTYNSEAFRWTSAGGMQGLGFLDTRTTGGNYYSYAYAVSADGSTVVGRSGNSNGNQEAFRWTSAGMQGLGFLDTRTTGGYYYSYAQAVSADGSAVVGSSYNSNNNYEAFRWTSAGIQGLGFIGTDTSSWVNAVSADGKVVVGGSRGSGNNAFRWSTTAGMQSIPQWLSGAGVTVATGWTPQEALGVNANGNVVVGYATDANGHRQAWLARVGPSVTPVTPVTSGTVTPVTPSTGSGLLTNLDTFNNGLIEAGSRGIQVGAALPNMTMFGAHHRSILDNGLARTSADGMCGWATADAGGNTNTHTNSQLSEIGVCKDLGTARIGVGIGQAWTQQDLSLNGSARYNGQYLVLEGANAYANGLQPSITGYYGRYDTQMSRNYTNGANVDSSTARPNATAYALRARLDWKDAAVLGKFNLSPYAAYTWAKTQLDAYTETGGGFPAQYAASVWNTDDLRLGGAAKTKLSDTTDLRLGLEGVHRFNGNTSGVNVSVIGLSVFNNSLAGLQVTQTWAHATVDVDHRITNKLALTVGASAATKGGDATWGATAGLRMNF
jgi:probable HAF family extracellular repeat protein